MNKISQQLWLEQWLKHQEPYMGPGTLPQDWDNLKTVMCASIMLAAQSAKLNHTEVSIETVKNSFNRVKYNENINVLKKAILEELAFPATIEKYVELPTIKTYLINLQLQTNTEGLAEIITAIVEKEKMGNSISTELSPKPHTSIQKI